MNLADKKAVFHPSLLESRMITDMHLNYALEARATYSSMGSLPSVNVDVFTDVDGSQFRYYVTAPNESLDSVEPKHGLIVRRLSFGNGDRPHARHNRVASQIIADMTGRKVLTLPQSIGLERNEYLSTSRKRRVKEIGYRAIAAAYMRLAIGRLENDAEAVYPFGFSEGAVSAAALYAESVDHLNVKAVGCGEPPTVTERSPMTLVADFLRSDEGETYADAARSTRIGAVTESLFLDRPLKLKAMEFKWLAELAHPRTLGKIALLRHQTLEEDLRTGLEGHVSSKVLLFHGDKSIVSPVAAVEGVAESIEKVHPARIQTVKLEGSGHGMADRMFDVGVIADHVTRLA